MSLRIWALNLILIWLVVALARTAGAEPAAGAPADGRPATVRSVLFKIRDAKTFRLYSVAPLQEITFRPRVIPGKDPLDPCSLCKPPPPPPRQVELADTYAKLDRNAWEGLRWVFDLLHPRRREDRLEVECSQKTLTCEVYDAEHGTPSTIRYVFVRTATGPRLHRLEFEPEPDLMHGI